MVYIHVPLAIALVPNFLSLVMNGSGGILP